MNIDAKIKNSKGYAIEQKINQFFLTKYIFKQNYLTLQKHLSAQLEQQTAFRMAHFEHRQELMEAQLETVRHLHNFIAGALSLVDHTRIFQRELFKEKDAFSTEYHAKVDADLKEDPLANFVKCFRQYIQHYKVPRISNVSNLVDKAEDIKAKIVVSKTDLLEFSGWTAPAKKFIQGIDDQLDLSINMEDYFQKIIDFHKWFEKRLIEIYRTELAELNTLKNEAIAEDLKLTVRHFAAVDDMNNNAFMEHFTRYYNDEQTALFEKLNVRGKVDFFIMLLKQNHFLENPQDEERIRKKLTY